MYKNSLVSGAWRPRFARYAVEDWATLALLILTALALVFSEGFWSILPF